MKRIYTFVFYTGLLIYIGGCFPLSAQQHMRQSFDSLYLAKLDLDTREVEVLDSVDMIGLIDAYYDFHAPSLSPLDRATDVLYNVGSEKVRAIYVLNVLKEFMTEFGYKQEVENVLQDMELCSKSEKNKQNAKKMIEQFYTVREGAVAPDTEFINAYGKVVKLSDYRDKMVFIQVWNMEYEQSLKALPCFMKLPAKYKDEKDLIFMTVFIGDMAQKNVWIQFLRENKYLDKMPHFISGTDEGNFKDLYCITDLPRYILIHRDGKIIDAWHYTVEHPLFDLGFRQELNRWNNIVL